MVDCTASRATPVSETAGVSAVAVAAGLTVPIPGTVALSEAPAACARKITASLSISSDRHHLISKVTETRPLLWSFLERYLPLRLIPNKTG